MTTDPTRIKALRKVLLDQDLAGFVIPLTDEHMSEYVGDYAGRLAWLTGFTGSAGMAIVTMTSAAIFTDGRYTLQVAAEVNADIFALETLDSASTLAWLVSHVSSGDRIGYDPELATSEWAATVGGTLDDKGAVLVATETNPIDRVWDEQPAPSLAPAFVHADIYAGETSAAKRLRLGREVAANGADVAVISMLDSLAWLLNIRGEDVAHTPVVRGYGLLFADGSASLFTEGDKIPEDVRAHLGQDVSVEDRSAFYDRLRGLTEKGLTLQLDPGSNNAKVFATVREAGGKTVEARDPCILAKAIKNTVELQGARNAHIRDGAAVTSFLHWLAVETESRTVDEIEAAERLWAFRQERDLIRDTSFDTISGAGPNGAIVHYRVTPDTNRPLETGNLYLVDSGGQYLDGTTDITRTVAIGTPTDEMREHYTRVLRGHIAMATAIFPDKTPGIQIDAYARRPLWEAGLDYDHGTGHGVGSFLGVHEGPQRVARFGGFGEPLRAGMMLSNEPGYYKAGAYGIRIENLVIVQTVDTQGERPMLGFETVTLAPLDASLIATDMLTPAELAWVNAYHQRVCDTLSPHVDEATKAWLLKACLTLSH